MRFAAKDHLAESLPLVEALTNAGHEYSADGPTDLFLIDLDPDLFGYRELIDFYRECGAVVLQYPHGAPASTLCYDNLYEPYEGVDGQLTIGQGEIDFLRSLGIQRPAKIMGWQLSDQFEPRYTDSPRRVVFAPTHVNADGGLDDERVAQNAEVFRQLLEGDWELVVRFIGELDHLGLWRDERVFRYVPAQRDMSTVEIDVADCVVAGSGTYPCLALARGVPTVMYGQFSAARYGLPDEQPKPLRSPEKYESFVRYPIDVEDGPLGSLIPYACKGWSSAVRTNAWREAWVGKPFDGPAFAKMVEEWVPELRAARDVPVGLAR